MAQCNGTMRWHNAMALCNGTMQWHNVIMVMVRLILHWGGLQISIFKSFKDVCNSVETAQHGDRTTVLDIVMSVCRADITYVSNRRECYCIRCGRSVCIRGPYSIRGIYIF